MKRFSLLSMFFLFLFIASVSCSTSVSANKSSSRTDKIYDEFWDRNYDVPDNGILQVSESFIDFGTVYIHSEKNLYSTRRIHLKNIGGGVVEYQTSSLMNDFYFDETLTTCGLTGGQLDGLASCVYVINFIPVSVSEPVGTIRITSLNEAFAVKIHGKGDIILRGNINADYDQIIYNRTMVNSSVSVEITVKNTGSEPVRFKTSIPKSPFKITDGSCALLNQRLESDETCTIVLSFEPTINGEYKDKIMLSGLDGLPVSNHYIKLEGIAISEALLTSEESELNFGLVEIGERKIKQLTLKNIGSLSINFKTTIPEGFSDAGSSCNLEVFQTLRGGESCVVVLGFMPKRPVEYTDIIRFTTNKNTTVDVKLIGAGIGDEPLLITPTSVNFGTVIVGKNSAEHSVVITNNAKLPIKFDITMPSDFIYQNSSSCSLVGSYLESLSSCTINIIFAPSRWSAYNDIVVLSYRDDVAGSISFRVDGKGIASGEIITTPTSVDFGNIEVNTISPTKVLTLLNVGGLPTTVSANIPAGFTVVSGSCALTDQILDPADSCTLGIQFRPTDFTNYDNNIVLSYEGKSKFVPILGRGATPPNISFSNAPIYFEDTAVGNISPVKNFVINSIGGVSATVSIALPPEVFKRAGGTCNMPISVIPAGSSCNLELVLEPLSAQSYSNFLTVTHAGASSRIQLSGKGYNLPQIQPVPDYTMNFGNVIIGLKSTTRSINLQNIGDRNADLSISLPQGFIYNSTSTCKLNNQILTPRSSCSLVIEFEPTEAKNYNDYINYNVLNGVTTQSQVQGQGLADATVTSTPPSLEFGDIAVNTTSIREIVLKNNGGVRTSINMALSNDFTLDNSSTCRALGQTLNAGDSCRAVISFTPTDYIGYNGTLTVTYNAFVPVGTKTLTVNISGKGVIAGKLSLSSSTLNFQETVQGSESPIVKVTASNIGGSAIDVSTTVPADFNLRSDLSTCKTPIATLTSGESCEYAFSFKPTRLGDISDTVVFRYGTESTNLTVRGKSIAGSIANFSPSSLSFNEITVNKKSIPLRVELSNVGDQILRYSITRTSTAFTIEQPSSTCPMNGTLAPTTKCLIYISLTPKDKIDYNEELVLFDTTKNKTTNLIMTGKGADAKLEISPPMVTFEDTKVNNTSSTAQITVKNVSSQQISFNRNTIPGFDIVTPPSGGVIPACGKSGSILPAGTSCIYNLQFKPLSVQNYNASMLFYSDNNIYELKLAGKGIPPTSLAYSTNSLNFHETAIDYEKQKSVTIENTTAKEVEFNILMPIDFDIDNSSTCGENSKLNAYGSCELKVNFKPDDSFEYDSAIQVTEKDLDDNTTDKIDVKAKSVKRGSVIYLYDELDNDSIKFTADDDNIFILNVDKGELSRFNRATKTLESLIVLDAKLSNPELMLDNATSLLIKDNKTKTALTFNVLNKALESKDFDTLITEISIKAESNIGDKIPDSDNYTLLRDKLGNLYLIDNISEANDNKSVEHYDIKTDKLTSIIVSDDAKRLSFKSSNPFYADGNIYMLDTVSGRVSIILP